MTVTRLKVQDGKTTIGQLSSVYAIRTVRDSVIANAIYGSLKLEDIPVTKAEIRDILVKLDLKA